jgi:hypothetical protein
MRVQLPSGWASGLKWGAIAGGLLYVVGLLLQLFSNALVRTTGSIDETQHPILLIPTCLGLFFLLFGLSAAGFYTGRETGRAGLGALAGIVAFVVQYTLELIYTPVTPGPQPTTTTPANVTLAQIILVDLIAAVLVLGIAACMGWLGGRPGARRSPLAAQLAASAKGPISEMPEPPSEE